MADLGAGRGTKTRTGLIRPIRAEDLAALAALIAEAGLAAWSEAQLAGTCRDPGARTRLAFAAPASGPLPGPRSNAGEPGPDFTGGPIGFVLARRILELVEIDLVGVAPTHRRRGLARELLGDLLRTEREAGAREARLELAEGSAAARALYEGLGFVVVGRRARYYPGGEDALLLTRVLPRRSRR